MGELRRDFPHWPGPEQGEAFLSYIAHEARSSHNLMEAAVTATQRPLWVDRVNSENRVDRLLSACVSDVQTRYPKRSLMARFRLVVTQSQSLQCPISEAS